MAKQKKRKTMNLTLKQKRLVAAIFRLEHELEARHVDLVPLLMKLEDTAPQLNTGAPTFGMYMRNTGFGMEPDRYERGKAFIQIFGLSLARELGFMCITQVCRMKNVKDKQALIDKIKIFRAKKGRLPGLSYVYVAIREIDPNVVKPGRTNACDEVTRLRLRIKDLEDQLAKQKSLNKDLRKELAKARDTIRKLR